jgi:hypothetical protein
MESMRSLLAKRQAYHSQLPGSKPYHRHQCSPFITDPRRQLVWPFGAAIQKAVKSRICPPAQGRAMVGAACNRDDCAEQGRSALPNPTTSRLEATFGPSVELP